MATVSVTYEVRDVVPESGDYICVPCGKRRAFEKGETFPSCLSCEEGRGESGEEVLPGIELWEKVGIE